MKKILPVLLGFICLAFATSAQTVFYVNKATGSDANTGASWATSFQNLTKALSAANASTSAEVQIWVAAGVYTPVDGITPAPVNASDTSFTFYRGDGIAKALKVYGGFAGTEASVTDRDATHITYLDGITGSGNSYHIGVIANMGAAADSVILDGLQFRNGIATNTGTKAFNGNNIQKSYGGGLVIMNAISQRVAIRNCVFDNNNAVSQVANGYGGAVYISNSFPGFERCTFSNNTLSKNVTAPSGNIYGGALYVVNGSVKVTGCAFNNNLSLADTNTIITLGGAIYLQACDSEAVFKHCSFTGNMARSKYNGYAYGGGIGNYNSFLRVIGCSFTGNQASDSAAISPALQCGGGAAYDNFLAHSVYDSCTFAYNKVSSSHGYGGTICDSAYSFTYVINSTVSNSSASVDGGALYSNQGYMITQRSDIGNNSANRGGAIFCTDQYPYVSSINELLQSNIHNNTAVMGGAVYNERTFLAMESDSLYNNTASNNGAAIYSDSVFLILHRLDIRNNSATAGSGGGVYMIRSECQMDTCTFGNNTAINGGGIMAADSAGLYVTRSVFTGNKATGNGGGISFGGSLAVPTDARLNCSRSAFVNNTAATGGGAISVNSLAGAGTADTMVSNLFIGNSATNAGAHGGAVAVMGSFHFICNNTFVSDSATYGGAISSQGTGSVMKAANNIFSNNYATATTSVDTSIDAAGVYVFTNNIYTGTDPLFVNAANPIGADGIWATPDDGLQLQHCSPAANTGNNAYHTVSMARDIAGNPRIIGSTIDIGAYETFTIGIITGADSICAGNIVTYTDTSLGGTWSSGNTAIITVNASSGVATALTAGTTTISYQHASSCGSDIETFAVTVLDLSGAATISGPAAVCAGSQITLTSSIPGGVWGHILSHTTVGLSGVVSGITAGADTIIYTHGNMCGSATTRFAVAVLDIPAPTISGPATVCEGTQITLTSSLPGGTWGHLLSRVFVAPLGVVSGITPGPDNITYTVSNMCGADTATFAVLVLALPPIATISGPATVCEGSQITLSSTWMGGTWGNMFSRVNVTPLGVVSGIAPGYDTVTYTISNTCGTGIATFAVNVLGIPSTATISGPATVCTGGHITLTSSLPGGAWGTIVGNTIVTPLGVVSGVNPGSDTVTYTISNTCGTSIATFAVTVPGLPPTATISGPSTVCAGSHITLTSSLLGGTWGSLSYVIVSPAGMVSGMLPGADTVTYTLSSACGNSVAIHPVTVYSIAQCDSAASVGVVTGSNYGLLLSPNPAHGSVNINLTAAITENATVIMTNSIGTKVKEWTISTNTNNEAVLDVPSGIYLITVVNSNVRYTAKIVIE